MKTPKRQINPNDPYIARDYCRLTLERAKHARWKRKNRTAKLKRSLTRYKDATNLPKYSHELRAYKLLQHLKKPGKKATMFEWTSYIHRLQEITFQIESALIAACISAGKHLERRIKQEATHKPAESGQQDRKEEE